MQDNTKSSWTESQFQRLLDLRVTDDILHAQFPTNRERDTTFQKIEKKLVKEEREKLSALLTAGGKPQLNKLSETLSELLIAEGFTQVSTPLIITKHALAKMTIGEDHPLFKQIYWLDKRQCLRPMLAPNLYSLLKDFSAVKQRPIRLFEIGSCFRKETDGAKHTSEFTMLNLVEMGLPMEERLPRLHHLATEVAKAAGLDDFQFMSEESAVYGTTVDLVATPDEIEAASGAMGPHHLDSAWGIHETWVGMGFGLERLLMLSQQDRSIGKWCKSLSYYNGIRLKV